ncbi:MAG: outer membrane protein assembly factor BamD [Geminicoccaceae bacterium]|nr:MAG: outer membrane protein assembly factor BamD [Geminicoccaceae bacterium]
MTAAVLLGLAGLGLSACGGGSREPEVVERPVEELYNAAMDLAANRQFLTAARAFEEVERQHPYSVWATRSMFMAAYALYEARRYDEAILAARRFVDFHPGNENVPYALYLIAMSYYEQISDVGRDQQMTANAQQAFTDLVQRFPNSVYARDAQLKLDLVRDHLAGKEMKVGRFYLNRRQYVAAINRFRVVLDEFQTTTHVPEALHRLVEAYTALGVRDEAFRYAVVLGYNYPGSPWYERTYRLVTDDRLPPIRS